MRVKVKMHYTHTQYLYGCTVYVELMCLSDFILALSCSNAHSIADCHK